YDEAVPDDLVGRERRPPPRQRVRRPRVQRRAVVPVGDDVLVVVGQEVEGGRVQRGGRGRSRPPVRLAVQDLADEVTLHRLDPGEGVCGGEAGPPPVVGFGGGALAREVAAGEAGEGLAGREGGGRSDALVEEGVRELLAAAGPTADEGFQLR